MIQVDKFCGCWFSLKTGAIMVGIILIILGFGCLCVDFWGLIGDGQMKARFYLNFGIKDVVLVNDGGNDLKFDNKVDRKMAIASTVVSLVFCILLILASSSLLYGVFHNKPKFIVPIVIFLPLNLVQEWIWMYYYFMATSMIKNIIMSLLYLYVWNCVLSFWKEIKEEPKTAKENIEPQT